MCVNLGSSVKFENLVKKVSEDGEPRIYSEHSETSGASDQVKLVN